MKKSTHTLFLEVVEENSIDLNSPHKLERVLCFNKLCDKFDWTELSPSATKLLLCMTDKYVNTMFDDPSSRGKSLKKMIG